MARISEASARRLGIAPRKPTSPRTRRKGRNRAPRILYPGDPVDFTIDLTSDPRPKERARTAADMRAIERAFIIARGDLAAFRSMVSGKAHRTFTPRGTKDYEEVVATAARAAMGARAAFTCPVEAELIFQLTGTVDEWPTSAADGDGDNLEKAVLDALNGIVFEDDRQVVRIAREKRCGIAPWIRIQIRPAAP